jgi:uncharacterized damage-inducible protein DinB
MLQKQPVGVLEETRCSQETRELDDEKPDPAIETWAIHNRINLYLLAAIPDDALSASMSGRGRSVHDLFGHIHNVRLMWLKAAAPELLVGLDKIDSKNPGSREQLATALEASGAAIEALLRHSIASGGRVKGFKPHATAFLGYLISHESHHRGQIEWALRLAGKPLPDTISYGMWEWGSR